MFRVGTAKLLAGGITTKMSQPTNKLILRLCASNVLKKQNLFYHCWCRDDKSAQHNCIIYSFSIQLIFFFLQWANYLTFPILLLLLLLPFLHLKVGCGLTALSTQFRLYRAF